MTKPRSQTATICPKRLPMPPELCSVADLGERRALNPFVRYEDHPSVPTRVETSAAARRGGQGWPRLSGHRRHGLDDGEHGGNLGCGEMQRSIATKRRDAEGARRCAVASPNKRADQIGVIVLEVIRRAMEDIVRMRGA